MTNPLTNLTPAQIDVLNDMVNEWMDQDQHGNLNGGWGYGPQKHAALSLLAQQVRDAWTSQVNYQDVEDVA